MRRLMRLVVEGGTGAKAAVPGYVMGGKTATAEKLGVGGYRHNANLSSFMGAFPMNAPRYAVMVLLDEPKGNKESFGFTTAGMVAAPSVARVVARIAPLMGLPPVDENAPEVRRTLSIDIAGGGPRIAQSR